MRTKIPTLILLATMLVPSAFAERGIGIAWQPMSLLGTEMMAEPLPNEDEMAVSFISRPHMFQAGLFEEIVAAVGTPHRLAGADKAFPKESNLTVLMNAKVSGEETEKARTIHIDLSKTTAKLLATHELSLEQVGKLLVACITKNLRANGQVREDQATFPIQWKLPPKTDPKVRARLPKKIAFRS